MRALIALRKSREETFVGAISASYDEICVLFRVGGSQGSFGKDSIEGAYAEKSCLCCEVVLAPREWPALGEEAIKELVTSRFRDAMAEITGSPYGQELSGIPID